MRDFLDIHAALGRDHDCNATARPVDQHGEIEFLLDIDAVGDIEPVDLLAIVAGLDGDQSIAEHFLGIGAHFVDRFRQTNAALGIRPQFLELALAAAARMDLGLYDI